MPPDLPKAFLVSQSASNFFRQKKTRYFVALLLFAQKVLLQLKENFTVTS